MSKGFVGKSNVIFRLQRSIPLKPAASCCAKTLGSWIRIWSGVLLPGPLPHTEKVWVATPQETSVMPSCHNIEVCISPKPCPFNRVMPGSCSRLATQMRTAMPYSRGLWVSPSTPLSVAALPGCLTCNVLVRPTVQFSPKL